MAQAQGFTVITGGAQAEPASETGVQRESGLVDVLELAALVGVVRRRLRVDDAFTDEAILASLKAICERTNGRERWSAAFNSNLGLVLALRGGALDADLSTLLGLLPRARS
jgi:hypothetical protein